MTILGRRAFPAPVILAAVLLAGSHVFAETTAEFYQGLQSFDTNGFPNDGTPLARLLGAYGTNVETVWEPPAPRPPGVGPMATKVLISKYAYSSSWTSVCGEPCASYAIHYVISIYFPDSFYVFSYYREDIICGGTSVTISTADQASHSQPNTFGLRSQLLAYQQSLAAGPSTESSLAAVRAPSGGTIQPEHNLDAFVGDRDALELRTGPGGTLDLRGFSPSNPVLTRAIPTSIFADTVLLDPGVSLNTLFALPPVVAPGEDFRSVKLLPGKQPNLLGRGLDEARVTVWNQGNVPEVTLVSWSDSAGWSGPGAVTRSLGPSEVKFVPIPLSIPETATSCEEDVLSVSVDPFFHAGAFEPAPFGTPFSLQMSIFADSDLDGDGYENSVDDCFDIADPRQSDSDSDFHGDLCDLDDGMIYMIATAHDQIAWQQEQGFDAWNLYRGSLSALKLGEPYTQLPGSNPLAARTCGVLVTELTDTDFPAPGQAAFYLVTGIASGIEGGLGTDSAGLARPNANPCP